MPVIEVKVNQSVTEEKKRAIAEKFVHSFANAGEEEVSHNVLVLVQGDVYLNFRGDDEQPSALVTIQPGPLTPQEDYAPIIKGFFESLKEELPQIDPYRIYMTVSEINFWGWGGKLL